MTPCISKKRRTLHRESQLTRASSMGNTMDPNTIAFLCIGPQDSQDYAKKAINDPANSSRRNAGLLESPSPINSRERRSPSSVLDETELCLYAPSLELRFDRRPRNGVGFLLGTDPRCDIVLPEARPSQRPFQCVITFDSEGRLILRDLGLQRSKSSGTWVTYNGEGGERRQGFTWILADVELGKKKPVIHISQLLQFRIIATQHIHEDWYQEQVAEFRDGLSAGASELDFDDITGSNIASSTSGMGTCQQEAILLQGDRLGRGNQAEVFKIWNVSTGDVLASKRPVDDRQARLRLEADLLNDIKHPNIVQFFQLITAPVFQLILEYVPLGSLDSQHKWHPISVTDSIEILHQGLAALQYLHGVDTPVAHRDIKPENILVQSRLPSIHIKLSDFGYSRASEHNFFSTYCGTKAYMAPEVFDRRGYSASVDIWSLGQVVLRYAHEEVFPDLHKMKRLTGRKWTAHIIESLHDALDKAYCPLLGFLSEYMVIDKAKLRLSARKCDKTWSKLKISGSCCYQGGQEVASGGSKEPALLAPASDIEWGQHHPQSSEAELDESDSPSSSSYQQTGGGGYDDEDDCTPGPSTPLRHNRSRAPTPESAPTKASRSTRQSSSNGSGRETRESRESRESREARRRTKHSKRTREGTKGRGCEQEPEPKLEPEPDYIPGADGKVPYGYYMGSLSGSLSVLEEREDEDGDGTGWERSRGGAEETVRSVHGTGGTTRPTATAVGEEAGGDMSSSVFTDWLPEQLDGGEQRQAGVGADVDSAYVYAAPEGLAQDWPYGGLTDSEAHMVELRDRLQNPEQYDDV